MSTAAEWRNRCDYARQMEEKALREAQRIGDEPLADGDPFAADLRTARYRAAVAGADAWADYLMLARDAWYDAVKAEPVISGVVKALLPHYRSAS